MGTASTMKKTGDVSRLYGSFADQNFPELLVCLQKTGKTGLLYIASDRVKKKIYFQDGVPTGARSNIKSELIGEMLIAKGVISREHQRFALEAQQERKISFGAVLVQEGVISAEELFLQARRQFLTVLFSLFGISKGNYKFEECELPPDGYYYDVAFSNMLVFGIRQMVNVDTLEEMVGDCSQIPTPGSQFLDYSKIMFTVKELSVINQVDGSKTIDEIIRASDVAPITVFKTLLILVHHEFIHLRIEIPEDEGVEEEIVELEESAKASLGFQEYRCGDPTEEQAVAGTDFRISPEGIHPTTDASEGTVAPAHAGQMPEPAGVEETARPEAEAPTTQTAAVINLDAENLDEVLSTFHDGAPVDTAESPYAAALTAEDAAEEESLPEAGTLSLDALLDRETESASGPVASAFRMQEPDDAEATAPAGASGEVAEPLPSFEEEDFGDRFLGDRDQEWSTGAFDGDDDEHKDASATDAPETTPSVVPTSVEAPPLPAFDGEDATGSDPETADEWDAPSGGANGTPTTLREPADDPAMREEVGTTQEDGPSPFLSDSDPANHSHEDPVAQLADVQAPGVAESTASEFATPPRRRRFPAFAFLLVFTVGAGVFAWTPWRTELQDWALSRLERSGAPVTGPAATPRLEILVLPAPPLADESGSTEEAKAVPTDARSAVEDVGEPEAAAVAEGPSTEEMRVGVSPGAPTAAEDLPDTGGAQEDAELQGVPSENPVLAAAAAFYPVEDWWARMKTWTDRVRDLPRSKFTIQVEISENIDFVWEDLNQLLPEYDAMVLRYRIKDWSAYTLIVGIYDRRAEGMEALQTLPPEILRLGPLVKTMATIQKGLVEPVAKP